jgi:hypothetical protein
MGHLREQADRVKTREHLARFIGALRRDLKADPGDWQNDDPGSYLDAMQGWVQDVNR